MFDGDVVVVHAFGKLFCRREYLVEFARYIYIARARAVDLGQADYFVLAGRGKSLSVYPGPRQNTGDEPVCVEQSICEVHALYLAVAVLCGNALRTGNSLNTVLCKAVTIHSFNLLIHSVAICPPTVA